MESESLAETVRAPPIAELHEPPCGCDLSQADSWEKEALQLAGADDSLSTMSLLPLQPSASEVPLIDSDGILNELDGARSVGDVLVIQLTAPDSAEVPNASSDSLVEVGEFELDGVDSTFMEVAASGPFDISNQLLTSAVPTKLDHSPLQVSPSSTPTFEANVDTSSHMTLGVDISSDQLDDPQSEVGWRDAVASVASVTSINAPAKQEIIIISDDSSPEEFPPTPPAGTPYPPAIIPPHSHIMSPGFSGVLADAVQDMEFDLYSNCNLPITPSCGPEPLSGITSIKHSTPVNEVPAPANTKIKHSKRKGGKGSPSPPPSPPPSHVDYFKAPKLETASSLGFTPKKELDSPSALLPTVPSRINKSLGTVLGKKGKTTPVIAPLGPNDRDRLMKVMAQHPVSKPPLVSPGTSTDLSSPSTGPVHQDNSDSPNDEFEEEMSQLLRVSTCLVWVRRVKGIDLVTIHDAVARVVGPQNIIAAHPSRDERLELQVRLREHADLLLDQGIVVGGNWCQVYRMSEKPVRVHMANVPPFITNKALVRALSKYGDICEKDITTVKMDTNLARFRHILTFKRTAWLRVTEHPAIPNSLKVKFAGKDYCIETDSGLLTCYKCGGSGHAISICNRSSSVSLDGDLLAVAVPGRSLPSVSGPSLGSGNRTVATKTFVQAITSKSSAVQPSFSAVVPPVPTDIVQGTSPDTLSVSSSPAEKTILQSIITNLISEHSIPTGALPLDPCKSPTIVPAAKTDIRSQISKIKENTLGQKWLARVMTDVADQSSPTTKRSGRQKVQASQSSSSSPAHGAKSSSCTDSPVEGPVHTVKNVKLPTKVFTLGGGHPGDRVKPLPKSKFKMNTNLGNAKTIEGTKVIMSPPLSPSSRPAPPGKKWVVLGPSKVSTNYVPKAPTTPSVCPTKRAKIDPSSLDSFYLARPPNAEIRYTSNISKKQSRCSVPSLLSYINKFLDEEQISTDTGLRPTDALKIVAFDRLLTAYDIEQHFFDLRNSECQKTFSGFLSSICRRLKDENDSGFDLSEESVLNSIDIIAQETRRSLRSAVIRKRRELGIPTSLASEAIKVSDPLAITHSTNFSAESFKESDSDYTFPSRFSSALDQDSDWITISRKKPQRR